MPTVNEITVLNIDDVTYEVASLSEQAQALVEVYNNWNLKEIEARGELAILQAAKQTLSAQIVALVREEAAAAEVAEAALAANDAPTEAEINVTTDETAAAVAEATAQDAVVASD